MNDVTGEKEERLLILVTGTGVSKLLTVATLPNGSAEAEAGAINDTIKAWKISDKIVAMCFDTTAVNSGSHSGVIVRLPRMLGRKWLCLACRHHVAELILKHTFEIECDRSQSDKLDVFRMFRAEYNSKGLFRNNPVYRTALDSEHTNIIIQPWRDSVLSFCQEQLEQRQPRNDYKELLELVIIFLGGVPPKGVKFRKTGSISRARWMSRAILYSKPGYYKMFTKYLTRKR